MKYIFPLLAIVLFTSCEKKDDTTNIQEMFDCEFMQVDENMDGLIDDQEKELMQECADNAYMFKNDIEKNLVGEWILVGHGEAWITTTSQPCAYIIINENELTYKFENATSDLLTTTTWEIEETQSPSFSTFRLKTANELLEGLEINQFSEEYMYGNYTPSDGNMYLYKKVN